MEMTTEEVFIELAMYYQHSDAIEAERKEAEKRAKQKGSNSSKK